MKTLVPLITDAKKDKVRTEQPKTLNRTALLDAITLSGELFCLIQI
jgi:hypothetical protein